MSTDSRLHHQERFLKNVAFKLGRPRRTKAPERPAFKHTCHQNVMAGWSQDQLKERFVGYALNALGADARVIQTSELSHTLVDVCQGYLAKPSLSAKLHDDIVLSADSRLLNALDIDTLKAAELNLYHWDEKVGFEANIEVCERAKVGVVYAEQALAESGTMVLYSQAKQGRAVSLLPEASVFVVPKSALVPRLTQATAKLREKAQAGERMPSCINFISGPSSTADIELIKVVGVHGPVYATYLILDDA